MAVRFDTAGEHFTTTVVPGTGDWTISCWARIAVDRDAFTAIWVMNNGGFADSVQLETAGDGTTLKVYIDGNDRLTGPNMVVGTWYYLVVTKSGTTLTLYYAAASDAAMTSVVHTGADVSLTASQLLIASETVTGSEWLNGSLAAFKVWDGVALTLSEIDAERWFYTPRRTDGLHRWHPFLVTETTDWSGNDRTLSGGTGSVTEDGPPIAWVRGKHRVISASTGGGSLVTYVGSSAAWAAGSTSITPAMAAGWAAGDLLVTVIHCKPTSTGTPPTINTPAGWTVRQAPTQLGTQTQGVDAGAVWQAVYERIAVAGDTAPAYTVTNGNVSLGLMLAFRKPSADTWEACTTTSGADTTSDTSFSVTGGANLSVDADDMVAVLSGPAGNATQSAPTLTATGATFGTINETVEGDTNTGNDLAATVFYAAVTAGPSTAAPVVGSTLSVARTGGATFVRVRSTPPANTAPSVDAGADATGTTGVAFSRTAVGTDPQGDTLTYAWTIQSAPGGSSATLTGASTATVGITPDVVGAYVLRCTVTDPGALSGFDEFTLTAVASPTFAALGSTVLGGGHINTDIPVPAGMAANEVAVLVLYIESDTAVTWPTGFEQLAMAENNTAGKEHRLYIAAKRATGADSGNYTVSHASAWTSGVAFRLSGVLNTGTLASIVQAAQGATTSDSTSAPALSLTTNTADTLLVYVPSTFDGGATYTPPSGFTEHRDAEEWSVNSLVKGAAGSTGSVSATASTSSAQSAVLLAFPSVSASITDSFNRADNTGSLGKADSGHTWSALAGGWGIQTNRAYRTTFNNNDVAAVNFGAVDQVVKVKLPVLSTDYDGIVARLTDVDNYYLVDVGSAGDLRLYKRVAATYTQLGSAANGTYVAGDTLELHVVGTSIVAKVNGVTKISATDSALTTGNNAGLRGGGSGGARFDDFSVSTPHVATLTDNLGLVDAASQVVASAPTTTDSLGLVDSVTVDFTAGGTLTATATDPLGLLDSGFAVAPVNGDLVGISDSVVVGSTAETAATVTDALGLADSWVSDIARPHTDAAGLSDSVAVAGAFIASQTDPAGLTDSVTASLERQVTDGLGATDSATQQSSAVVTRTNALGLTDATTVSVTRDLTDPLNATDSVAGALQRAVTDSAGLADSVSGHQVVTTTDSAGLQDSAASALTLPVTASDTLGLADAAQQVLTNEELVSDSLGLTDNVTTTSTHLVTTTDGLGITGEPDYVIGGNAQVADQLGLTDSIAAGAIYEYQPTDALGATDEVTRSAATAVSDAVGLVDTATAVSDVPVAVVDGLAVTDTPSLDTAKTTTDAGGLSDAAVAVITLTAEVVDAAGLTDSASAVLSIAVTAIDTLGLADSQVIESAEVETLQDAIGIADAVATAGSFVVEATDPLGLTDTADTGGDLLQTITDPVGATDATAASSVSQRDTADALGLLDSTGATVSVETSDALGLVDSKIGEWDRDSDFLGLTDDMSYVTGVALFETQTDALGLSDTTTTEGAFQVQRTDPLGLSDTPTTAIDVARAHTDPLGLTDQTALAGAFNVAATDSLGLSDATTVVGAGGVSLVDPVGLTDSATRVADRLATQSDALGLTDSVLDVLSAEHTIVDGAGISDSVTVAQGLAVALGDGLGLTDAAQYTQTAAPERTVGDTLGLSDAVIRESAATAQVTDAAGLTDSVGAGTGLVAVLTDGLGLSDSVALSLTSVLSDVVGGLDSVEIISLRQLTDAVGAADSIFVATSVAIEVADGLALSDSTQPAAVLGLEVTESASLTDAIEAITGFPRVAEVTDVLGLTDSAVVLLSDWVGVRSTVSIAPVEQQVAVHGVVQFIEAITEAELRQFVVVSTISQSIEVSEPKHDAEYVEAVRRQL